MAFTLSYINAIYADANTNAAAQTDSSPSIETAIFGMGCFWCAQSDFDKVAGVVSTTVGYDGGTQPNPTYKQVSAGGTHYVEVVQVKFDPSVITYAQILEHFWPNIDPTVNNQQFCDHGSQYSSVIFYLSEQQKQMALASLAGVEQKFTKVYTKILPSTQFYPAEEYHQKYYKKNPLRYRFYRWNCGRDQRLEKIWGDDVEESTP